jgi:hypothetical protein
MNGMLSASCNSRTICRSTQIGADKAAQHDHTTIDKQFGDFAYPSNVLGAVFGTEAQVFVDAETNIVTIEAIHQHATLVERLFQRNGNCALARTRQTGEPERRSAVSQ